LRDNGEQTSARKGISGVACDDNGRDRRVNRHPSIALPKLVSHRGYNPSADALDRLCTYFKCRIETSLNPLLTERWQLNSELAMDSGS